MKRKKKISNREIGQKFEKKVQRCINSGAFWFDKADLKTEEYLIDAKFTKKKGFRITTKLIKKIWNEAFDTQKLPAIILGIEEKDCLWILEIQIKRRTKNET